MECEAKNAIDLALKKQIEIKSLDHVSITELCAQANVNRQTFYYHYSNLVEAVCHIIIVDVRSAIVDGRTYNTWTHGFLMTVDYMHTHKNLLLHIFHSKYWGEFDIYFCKFNSELLTAVIKECADLEHVTLSDKDFHYILTFYQRIFHDTFIDYLLAGMEEDPHEVLIRTLKMVSGDVSRAIIAFS